jgi:hypothetical protein
MRKVLLGLSVLLALGLILTGCTEIIRPAGFDAFELARKATNNGMSWNSADGFKSPGVLQDWVNTVLPFESNGPGAGTKIPSNSHSAAIPDVFFAWDNKQRDDGFLKIRASYFETFAGFVLTKKVSSTYWDYHIFVNFDENGVADHKMTEDGKYFIFYIPKGKGYLTTVPRFAANGFPIGYQVVEQPSRGACNKNINWVHINTPRLRGNDVTEIIDVFPPNPNQYVISFEKVVTDEKGNELPLAEWIDDKDFFEFTLWRDGVQVAGAVPTVAVVDGKLIVSFIVSAGGRYEVRETITGGDYLEPGRIFVEPTLQSGSTRIFSRPTSNAMTSPSSGNAFVFNNSGLGYNHTDFVEQFMTQGVRFGVLYILLPILQSGEFLT